MDNLNTHYEHAYQPQGAQENAPPFALPTSQVLDGHMISQPHTNLPSFLFSLEQHRLQLDQVLQLHNEQVRVSLQQQISMQNSTLLNLVESVTRDALMQKNDEIASLQIELQKMQENLQTVVYDRDEWMTVAQTSYGINGSLIDMISSVQMGANSHVSSNDLGAPSSRGQAPSMAKAAVETTQPNLICKVCNSSDACMLVLPCQHLCACKPCGAYLAACPVCGVLKDFAIEARFV